MHLTRPTAVSLSLLLTCCLWDVEGRKVIAILKVTNGLQWGEWGAKQFCPKGYARGFRLKVQPYLGLIHDDSSVNGIRLHCTDGSYITSSVGPVGTWSNEKSCKARYLTSFSLRVLAPQRFDNTGVTNIKFKCKDQTVLEGGGHTWGKYGSWSPSCKKGGICGIQTKVDTDKTYTKEVEPYRGPFHDDSSLNGIRLRCSDGTLIEEDGKYGEWSFEQSCWSGFLTQFSLRMTNYMLPRDNTAANNIKFKCTDGWELEGTGHKWGDYTEWSQSCIGVGICGFQTKKDSKLFFWDRTGLNDVEPYRGLLHDNTSLNGIRLWCSDGSFITSAAVHYNPWTAQQSCKSGSYLTSFALRVTPYQWIFDDTAANNIKFKCSDGTVLEGSGLAWGRYGSWSQSCPKGGICGIQTRVEKHGPKVKDHTGLHDVKFFCCS